MKNCSTANRGIYIDGEFSDHSSLHANMMALAFDLVPEEHKKTVIDFIKSRGMACSVYGAQFLLEGLYNAGESDYAMSLLTAISRQKLVEHDKIGINNDNGSLGYEIQAKFRLESCLGCSTGKHYPWIYVGYQACSTRIFKSSH